MRRKKMHAIQQPPGTTVHPHPDATYVSLLESAIRLLSYTALAAAPPLDTPTNHVTPTSDHDVADKKQPDTSAATSEADLEQENMDLKREVGLHQTVMPHHWCDISPCHCCVPLQVEYLREELRKARAELSECVFFKEKAEAQLK